MAEVRAAGHHRRRAARDGRLEPRARGLPPLRPARRRRARAARARLDRAAGGRGGGRRDRRRRRRSSSSPRSRAARSSRTRCSRHFRALPARPVALRRHHRPGHVDAGAGRGGGLPPRLPRRPRDRRALLRAVALRHRPGRARGRDVQARARGRAGRGRELRAAGGQLGPVARRRARRAGRCRGRDKLTFVVDPPMAASASGPSSSSPSRPASRGAGILPVADEPLVDPERYGPRPRVRPPARRRRARPAARRGRSARSRRPATRRSR